MDELEDLVREKHGLFHAYASTRFGSNQRSSVRQREKICDWVGLGDLVIRNEMLNDLVSERSVKLIGGLSPDHPVNLRHQQTALN